MSRPRRLLYAERLSLALWAARVIRDEYPNKFNNFVALSGWIQ